MAKVEIKKKCDRPKKVLIVYKYTDKHGALISDGMMIEVVDRENILIVFKEKFDKIHPKSQFKILSYYPEDLSWRKR